MQTHKQKAVSKSCVINDNPTTKITNHNPEIKYHRVNESDTVQLEHIEPAALRPYLSLHLLVLCVWQGGV